MDTYAFNNLTYINLAIRPGDSDAVPVVQEVKNTFYKNNYFGQSNNTKYLIYYNQIESDQNRIVAEFDSVTTNEELSTPNKNLDTPIDIFFNESPELDQQCQIEFYRNILGSLTIYDFRRENANIVMEYIFNKNDEFINENPNFEIYQTIILINTSALNIENKKHQILRDSLGRINYIFLSDLVSSAHVVYDSIRYLCELLQLNLRKLKAGTTPDIRTTFDVRHNFSNVALRIFSGNKWIHSHGRNKKRMADIKLLLGKNLDALELYQQALSSSRHSGDRLFKAASNFGAAICLYKISLLSNSFCSNNSKFSHIISYFKQHSSISRHSHHADVLEDCQASENSSESENEDLDVNIYSDSAKLNPYIRECIFGCLNTLMRLKTFPFTIFCGMAKSACWFFTSAGMVYEFYKVISLLSTFSSLEGKNQWLGEVVKFLSDIGVSRRKLSFYTLEIASDPSLNAAIALEACKLIGRQLGLDDHWKGEYGWNEVKLAVMEVAYNAATSVGSWNEANNLLWSMLLIPTSSSTCQKILQRLNTISLLAQSFSCEIGDILRLAHIKPILTSLHSNPPTSARIRPLDISNSDGQGKYKIRRHIKLNKFKIFKKTSLRIIKADSPYADDKPTFRIYTLDPKNDNLIEHQVLFGNVDYWEVSNDELIRVTVFNNLPCEISLQGLSIIADNLEYSSPPTNYNLSPGANTLIINIKPLASGTLSLSGIKFFIASKHFSLLLPKKVLVNVKAKLDVQTETELLPFGDYNIFSTHKNIPMLFNKPKKISLCKCTQAASCSRLCYNIINNASQRPIDTYDEVLYEGEIRYGLARLYNLSQHVISNIKVSFGVNDWRSSQMLFTPLELKTSKCRLSKDYYFSASLGASPISTTRLNDTARSSKMGITRTIFSSDEFKLAPDRHVLTPGAHLVVPFILNASSWASQISIGFHWTAIGKQIGPVEARIANPVLKLLDIPEDGINVYPYAELDAQMAMERGINSVFSLRSHQNYKHMFDNPKIMLHIKFINLVDTAVLCITNSANEFEQAVKIDPYENKSICITCNRVPRTKKRAFEYLDRKINLRWKMGDRCGHLLLSRLVKMALMSKNDTRCSSRRAKDRAVKNTPRMALWRRGVYMKTWLDDRRQITLCNQSDLYEPSVYLDISFNKTAVTGVMFDISVSVINIQLEPIRNCWIVIFPYTPESLLCSGVMEVKVTEIPPTKGHASNQYRFTFLAVRSGEYQLAAALIREDDGTILWHHKEITITCI